jgi:predicted RND superfamily exporter protein
VIPWALPIPKEGIVDSKVILMILAVIGVMTICATLFRGFWFALIGGGPMFLGVVVICIFLLGVFIGSSLKR